ncbi:hypothetical protein KIL84_020533 [Mauremys mutica]|uniref:Uncharacterized protein n=1 Tax=Mauremys mutica TaxID=74926 RepID=A0A9D4BCD0_9SAUR|nr:hypothetical protein KIL84_020533 [Mauremys mutica]
MWEIGTGEISTSTRETGAEMGNVPTAPAVRMDVERVTNRSMTGARNSMGNVDPVQMSNTEGISMLAWANDEESRICPGILGAAERIVASSPHGRWQSVLGGAGCRQHAAHGGYGYR